MNRTNYTNGQLLGDCIYIEDAPSPSELLKQRRYAKFKCVCSNEFISQVDSVKRGLTRSCGCLNTSSRIENGRKNKTHGMSKTRAYFCWQGLKSRCYNSDNESYHGYGGRGIIVCERWCNSFENFYDDIGQFCKEGLEIDRIDVNGNYSPENCRLVNEQVQAWNQRVYKKSTTSCAGVTRTTRNKNKFEVRISKDNKEYHIGTFNTLEDAILARKRAEVEFYGTELDVKRSTINTST